MSYAEDSKVCGEASRVFEQMAAVIDPKRHTELHQTMRTWADAMARGEVSFWAPIARTMLAGRFGPSTADARGLSMRFEREDWGVVIDALIEHRRSALTRKARNSASGSDVRAQTCERLIRLLNTTLSSSYVADRLRRVDDLDSTDRLPPAVDPHGQEVDHDCEFRRMLREVAQFVDAPVSPGGLYRAHAVGQAVRALALRLAEAREEVASYQAMTKFDEHRPHRESNVAVWIEAARDDWANDGGVARPPQWQALDELLNDYLRHADTDTPLPEPVPQAAEPSEDEAFDQLGTRIGDVTERLRIAKAKEWAASVAGGGAEPVPKGHKRRTCRDCGYTDVDGLGPDADYRYWVDDSQCHPCSVAARKRQHGAVVGRPLQSYPYAYSCSHCGLEAHAETLAELTKMISAIHPDSVCPVATS